MLSSTSGARAALAVLLFLGRAAWAEPSQCLGRGRAQWMVDETFLAVANPDGFENQLRADACLPFIDRPGILFDYSQIELGFFSYVSPIYVHLGTYVAVSPLSFLILRADAAGLVIWPLPLEGAGYHALPAYRRDVGSLPLPAADARSAAGANLSCRTCSRSSRQCRFAATLRCVTSSRFCAPARTPRTAGGGASR